MAWLRTALLLILAIVITTAAAVRLVWILDPQRKKPIRHGRRNPHEPTHLMIVLGSGGHTAEMIGMLERAVNDPDLSQRLDWRDYTHRTWVISSGDALSAQRAKDFEEMAVGLSNQEVLMSGKVKKATDLGPGTYDIHVVPRAREIHQPLITAPVSSLKCAYACWSLLSSSVTDKLDFPDLILVNGPATATVMVFVSIIMRFLNIKGSLTRYRMRTVYIESWARVKTLSLSATLLSRIVDRFVVQWPQLEKVGGNRTQYLGVLV